MTNYAKTALKAVELYQGNAAPDPAEAWKMAAEICVKTLSGRNKSCPRSAFLGLCEKGLVKGVPPGMYTRSECNKSYAICAVRLLRSHSHLSANPTKLWREVMRHINHESQGHDGQMNVVIALWNASLIEERLIVDS